MKKWKIVYQDTPFNYTNPACVIVEAETAEAAYATAYEHLSQRGHCVIRGTDLESKLDWDLIEREYGITKAYVSGRTHIRTITEHTVKAPGRVVEG